MSNWRSFSWVGVVAGMAVLTWQSARGESRSELLEVARSDQQWTGVAISREARIFVNFPRWSPQVTLSVAELLPDGTREPFPDAEWNTWRQGQSPRQRFVCVQSVHVDDQNYLWILDPANPEFKGTIPGGPKLVKVDLRTNGVVQTVRFDERAAPRNSYLNDVRVDTRNRFAYITDSGAGALVVVNLATGQPRRLLANHPSTKSEGTRVVINGRPWLPSSDGTREVHADGITLDPDGRFLNYHALTGRTLWRIETRWLRDETLSDAALAEKVEALGTTGPTDGLEADLSGNIYLTAIEDNAVKRFTPDRRLEIVAQDERLAWPDSLAWGGDWLYVTASQTHFGQNPPGPYRLLKFKPVSILAPTGRDTPTSENRRGGESLLDDK